MALLTEFSPLFTAVSWQIYFLSIVVHATAVHGTVLWCVYVCVCVCVCVCHWQMQLLEEQARELSAMGTIMYTFQLSEVGMVEQRVAEILVRRKWVWHGGSGCGMQEVGVAWRCLVWHGGSGCGMEEVGVA